jgi:hypothetical protein
MRGREAIHMLNYFFGAVKIKGNQNRRAIRLKLFPIPWTCDLYAYPHTLGRPTHCGEPRKDRRRASMRFLDLDPAACTPLSTSQDDFQRMTKYGALCDKEGCLTPEKVY